MRRGCDGRDGRRGWGVAWDGAVRARGGEVVRRDDDARDDGMTDETRDAERGRRTASAIDRETAHDRARVGPDRSRDELVPFLTERDDESDECLLAIATELTN